MCYQIFGVMRMSALRQLPPQGSYVNADGVLLARMSLLGRFYEVPEHLFISRRHSGQSMATLPVRLKQPRRFRLTNRYCSSLPCSRVVGSDEKPSPHISGVSSVARIFFVHLSRAPWRWTEASLLFHVVILDQDTDQHVIIALQANFEGFSYCSRSGAV